jgi:hypothetical protein
MLKFELCLTLSDKVFAHLQYEAKFPSNAGKIAKENWNSFKSDLRCATGNTDDETLPEKMETQFLCGLHVQMKNDQITGDHFTTN